MNLILQSRCNRKGSLILYGPGDVTETGVDMKQELGVERLL